MIYYAYPLKWEAAVIYVLEDDQDIRALEVYLLKSAGYEVAEFSAGPAFEAAVAEQAPELVVLDIMLPGVDGLSLLRRLRTDPRTAHVPVMLVTAKTAELDKVEGLETGADDYLGKPFGVMEFNARVKALLRRSNQKPQEAFIVCGPLVMDDARRKLTVDGASVLLTYKEYELLRLLMVNRGIVLRREQILNKVWGYDYEGETRTIDMHIKQLRHKLSPYGDLIKTVHNVGYQLELP